MSHSLTIRQKIYIENKTGIKLLENGFIEIKSFKRFISNGMLIHTTMYGRLKKRNNSSLYLQNGKFVDIIHFLSISICTNKNDSIVKNILLGNELTPISNSNNHLNTYDAMTNNLAIITEESNNIICFFQKKLLISV